VVTGAARARVRIACVRQYRVANRALDAALVLGYGNLATGDVDEAVARLATVAGRLRTP
jgi:hypothetical protein